MQLVGLVALLLFFWLVVRATRAGHGLLILWFALIPCGLALSVWAGNQNPNAGVLLGWFWAGAQIGIPVYALIRRAIRGGLAKS